MYDILLGVQSVLVLICMGICFVAYRKKAYGFVPVAAMLLCAAIGGLFYLQAASPEGLVVAKKIAQFGLIWIAGFMVLLGLSKKREGLCMMTGIICMVMSIFVSMDMLEKLLYKERVFSYTQSFYYMKETGSVLYDIGLVIWCTLLLCGVVLQMKRIGKAVEND